MMKTQDFYIWSLREVGRAKSLADAQAIARAALKLSGKLNEEAVREVNDTGMVDVHLDTAPSQITQKINAIKETRQVTGMGLKESKDWIEGISVQPLRMKYADAEKFKAAIGAVGVKVRFNFLDSF